MFRFRSALDDCGLEDLGFTGNGFTWRQGNWVKERLDRFVAIRELREVHLNVVVSHSFATIFDHVPIYLDIDKISLLFVQSQQTRKYFEIS